MADPHVLPVTDHGVGIHLLYLDLIKEIETGKLKRTKK
jgi:hypothetical protein